MPDWAWLLAYESVRKLERVYTPFGWWKLHHRNHDSALHKGIHHGLVLSLTLARAAPGHAGTRIGDRRNKRTCWLKGMHSSCMKENRGKVRKADPRRQGRSHTSWPQSYPGEQNCPSTSGGEMFCEFCPALQRWRTPCPGGAKACSETHLGVTQAYCSLIK